MLTEKTQVNDIRLLALDLDGTLLTGDKQITPRTKSAIEAAIRKGIEVVPVTGRPFSGLPPAVMEIPGIRYVITSNGAVTLELYRDSADETGDPGNESGDFKDEAGDPGNESGEPLFHADVFPVPVNGGRLQGRIRREALIRRDIASEIIRQPIREGLLYNVFVDGYGYSDPQTYEKVYADFQGTALESYVKQSRRSCEDVFSMLNEPGSGVENIWIVATSREQQMELYDQIRKTRDLQVVLMRSLDLEVGSCGADKGLALADLSAELGIRRPQIMAVGDGGNDLGMLKAAGIAVAMGNATDDVKQMADCITGSNEADGVAQVIDVLLQ